MANRYMQREPDSTEVVIYVDAAKTRSAATFCCSVGSIEYKKITFKKTVHSAFLPNNLSPTNTEALGVLEAVLFLERVLHGLAIPHKAVDLKIYTDCAYVVNAAHKDNAPRNIQDILDRVKRLRSFQIRKISNKNRAFRKVHEAAVHKRKSHTRYHPIVTGWVFIR